MKKMPLHYLDTSAIVKCYLPEIGSGWVTSLRASEPVMISLLSMPEVASALSRRAQEGDLGREQCDAVFARFLVDSQQCVVLSLTQPVIREATTLLFSGPPTVRLRTLDALHLASARHGFSRARRRGLAVGSFITSDRALLEAAHWAGLVTTNPEDHP